MRHLAALALFIAVSACGVHPAFAQAATVQLGRPCYPLEPSLMQLATQNMRPVDTTEDADGDLWIVFRDQSGRFLVPLVLNEHGAFCPIIGTPESEKPS